MIGPASRRQQARAALTNLVWIGKSGRRRRRRREAGVTFTTTVANLAVRAASRFEALARAAASATFEEVAAVAVSLGSDRF